ncbi:MAG: 3'-5' exonuclease [Candidatus Bathyarchaeia archaeon]
MSAKTLEEFGIFKSEKEEAKLSPQLPEEATEKPSVNIPAPEASKELPDSYLVSATYDSQKHAALLKLYEPKTKTLHFWYDNTGHQPYLLTNLSPEELAKISKVASHPGLDHFELVKKYDPLNDQEITLTKVVVKDPLAVGGRVNSLREVIPSERPDAKVWEADIKYYECFMYDRGLVPGMLYKIVDGQLIQADFKPPLETLKMVSLLFKDEHPEIREAIENWVNLLECPLPEFRRVAVDIEVGTDVPTRVPDPHKAEYPIIAVSLVGSDGMRRILLLKPRPKPIPEVGDGSEKLAVTPEYYSNEKELIIKVYEVLRDYPFIITFNGDDFDLRYLCHRGENLGIKEDQNPIELGKEFALMKTGVHIDLYKFFFNRSVQTYAFGQRYHDITLDDIGSSLLGIGKIFSQKPISELTYTELANYCLRDAELTYQLTAFNDNLVMKLIMIITRIAKMPMEDVTRTGISQWIRSLLNFEHRRRNWLIPRPEDLFELKGITATKAIIKGKKY